MPKQVAAIEELKRKERLEGVSSYAEKKIEEFYTNAQKGCIYSVHQIGVWLAAKLGREFTEAQKETDRFIRTRGIDKVVDKTKPGIKQITCALTAFALQGGAAVVEGVSGGFLSGSAQFIGKAVSGVTSALGHLANNGTNMAKNLEDSEKTKVKAEKSRAEKDSQEEGQAKSTLYNLMQQRLQLAAAEIQQKFEMLKTLLSNSG